MSRVFTKENPPKSGSCKKLWEWWKKHKGHYPDKVESNGAGICQRNAGACSFIIAEGSIDYLVYDVEETLKTTPDSSYEDLRIVSTYHLS